MGWIFLFRVHALIRDSPAYAGNTVPRAVKEILDQDHPPLARGILGAVSSPAAAVGIIPACAGNT